MLGRYIRKIAIQLGVSRRLRFIEFYSGKFFLPSSRSMPFEMVSFSGSKYFWDQIYSICSFQRNVGTPILWTVYSDGSYTKAEIDEFEKIPFVKVAQIETTNLRIEKSIFDKYPLLKKLSVFSNHKSINTTIFCDSDILYFPDFGNYIEIFRKSNWFLPDEGDTYFDDEYLNAKEGFMFSLNSGFLVINQRPNWTLAWNYIENRIECKLPITHWSEQTAVQSMVEKSNDFLPLDPRKFIVNGSDSFLINILPQWQTIALRHYIGPIRHKMWQTNWKDVLKEKG